MTVSRSDYVLCWPITVRSYCWKGYKNSSRRIILKMKNQIPGIASLKTSLYD